MTEQLDKATLLKRLTNKAWRMANMYQIVSVLEDGTSKIIPFVPRPEQERFYRERHTRNIVPKARKYGMSTAIVLDYADDCMFARPGFPVHAAHVDYRDSDAKKKLEIVKTAWDYGPKHPNPAIAELWNGLHITNPLTTRNDHELQWTNGSKQQASTSFMGGTPSRMHISEFGPLAAQFPEKAAKLKRGTFNAVPLGGTFDIETTMEGGAFGDCYAIFDEARKKMGQKLLVTDWKLFFIPWMSHPDNRLVGQKPKKESTLTYIEEIRQKYGVTADDEQWAWYEGIFAVQKWDMFTQHPTVIDECLQIGSGASFFDPPGLEFQRAQAVGLETELHYGDITIQGDIKNVDERSASWREVPKAAAPFCIYEHPIEGEKYLLWADFGVGKQAAGSSGDRDTNAFGIIRDGRIDPQTREYRKPQMVLSCQPDDRSITTETIRRIVAASIYYGDCMTVPEVNNKDNIAERLMVAGVRRMYRQGIVGADGSIPGTTKTDEVYGWLTTGTADGGGTRGQILDNMQHHTMQQAWIATFPWIIEQMVKFIINKHGRPEGAPGVHDDFVMGPAIGLFALPHATKFVGRVHTMVNEYRQAWQDLNADPRGV